MMYVARTDRSRNAVCQPQINVLGFALPHHDLIPTFACNTMFGFTVPVGTKMRQWMRLIDAVADNWVVPGLSAFK